MDSLWHKLQEEVVSFKSATEEKRRIYNDLLAKDKKGVAEVAENNKKIQKLMVKKMLLSNHPRYLLEDYWKRSFFHSYHLLKHF